MITKEELDNLATDIAVMRGSQERREAIIKLVNEYTSLSTNVEASRENEKTGWLTEDEVEWVVNDNAELGVKISDKFFWLYKGESLDYGPENTHDDGTPMKYRRVGKREFGECCHPLHLKVLPDKYIEGEGWRPLPSPPKEDKPENR